MTEQRPLKFRAFDGKRMTQLDALILSYTNGWNIGRGEAAHLLYTPHKKVMQFTGLLDKNGVEVYEGDIVKHQTDSRYPANICVVKNGVHDIQTYDDDIECNGWYLDPTNGEFNLYLPTAPTERDEVIGNIYEHPHLLSEGGEG